MAEVIMDGTGSRHFARVNDLGRLLTDTAISGTLAALVSGTLAVSGDDFNIRNLNHPKDNVAIWGNTSSTGSGNPMAIKTDVDGRLVVSVYDPCFGVQTNKVAVTQPDSSALFNTNANLQVGEVDVSDTNPVPISGVISASVTTGSESFIYGASGTGWVAVKVLDDGAIRVYDPSGAAPSVDTGSKSYNFVLSGATWIEEPQFRNVIPSGTTAISGIINTQLYAGSKAWIPAGSVIVTNRVAGSIVNLPGVTQGTSPWVVLGSTHITNAGEISAGNAGSKAFIYGNSGTGWNALQTDGTGNLIIVGNIEHGETDGGNPIEIGGFAASSAPTAQPIGARVRAWFDRNGRQAIYDGEGSITVDGEFEEIIETNNGTLSSKNALVGLRSYGGNQQPMQGFNSTDDGVSTWSQGNLLGVLGFNMVYDSAGQHWDRMKGTSDNGVLVNLGDNNDIQGDEPHSDPDSGNPVKIGAKVIDYEPDSSGEQGFSEVTANDRANIAANLRGELITAVKPEYWEPDNVSTIYGTAGSSFTSSWHECWQYRDASLGFQLYKSGTPTDIVFKVELDLGNGSAVQLTNGPLGLWIYDDQVVGTNGLSEAYTFPLAGYKMGIKADATGMSTGNAFIVSGLTVYMRT